MNIVVRRHSLKGNEYALLRRKQRDSLALYAHRAHLLADENDAATVKSKKDERDYYYSKSSKSQSSSGTVSFVPDVTNLMGHAQPQMYMPLRAADDRTNAYFDKEMALKGAPLRHELQTKGFEYGMKFSPLKCFVMFSFALSHFKLLFLDCTVNNMSCDWLKNTNY